MRRILEFPRRWGPEGTWRNSVGSYGVLWRGERAYRKVRARRERMINDEACQGTFETSMPNMNC